MPLIPVNNLGLTRRRILAHLWSADGRPVKYREMMRLLGFTSPNAIMDHLEAMRRDHLVTWERYRAGTLRAVCRFIPANELESTAGPLKENDP